MYLYFALSEQSKQVHLKRSCQWQPHGEIYVMSVTFAARPTSRDITCGVESWTWQQLPKCLHPHHILVTHLPVIWGMCHPSSTTKTAQKGQMLWLLLSWWTVDQQGQKHSWRAECTLPQSLGAVSPALEGGGVKVQPPPCLVDISSPTHYCEGA